MTGSIYFTGALLLSLAYFYWHAHRWYWNNAAARAGGAARLDRVPAASVWFDACR